MLPPTLPASRGAGQAAEENDQTVQPATLPHGLRTTRVIAYVQGALGVLNGALLISGGAAFATALSLQGTGGAALIIAIGVVVAALSALLIWGGVLLGRRSRRARYGVLAGEYVAIVLGLLSLPDLFQAGLLVIPAAVAIYYLQFEAATKAAFARPRPAA
jgi:hypothetical protein